MGTLVSHNMLLQLIACVMQHSQRSAMTETAV